MSSRLNHLARAWWRGEWGKARWQAPVKAEALATQTCQKCRAAFVCETNSTICPDCS